MKPITSWTIDLFWSPRRSMKRVAVNINNIRWPSEPAETEAGKHSLAVISYSFQPDIHGRIITAAPSETDEGCVLRLPQFTPFASSSWLRPRTSNGGRQRYYLSSFQSTPWWMIASAGITRSIWRPLASALAWQAALHGKRNIAS